MSDVFESTASRDDFLKAVYLNWEILPPGEKDESVNRILSGFRNNNLELRKKLVERYELLAQLKPINYIQGTSGFQRYFWSQIFGELGGF